MIHRCGGELQPQTVIIELGQRYYRFAVDGYRCDRCGEEVIPRDTALEIDKILDRIRSAWSQWKIPYSTTETRF